jgi:hypothetical protein
MTSRTFPLSRQRRRRIVNRPLQPTQDGQGYAAPADAQPLGNEVEREPADQRDAAGRPVDDATHEAGARPAAARLPHEHDEYADSPHEPRAVMQQAEADLDAGLQDTDCRNAAAATVFGDRNKNRNCP